MVQSAGHFEYDVDSNTGGSAAERVQQSLPSNTDLRIVINLSRRGASFGAATNVHRRLALFGEAGFVWSRSDLPLGTIVTGSQSPLGGIESTRTTVNTRAVGGVMFLF